MVLAGLLLLALASHYGVSRGRFFSEAIGSRKSLDHGIDIALLVAPVFLMGVVLVGFRPLDAGFDTANYIKTWLALDGVASAHEVGTALYGNTEFLWWPLQSLLTEVVSARGWLLINYVLVFLAVFWAYWFLCRRYSVNPFIFVFVFLTYYFVYSGNTMRQALALPLGLLAFFWWFDRRYLGATAVLVLSIGLHWSSILFLLAPLLSLRFLQFRAIFLGVPLLALAGAFFVEDIARLVVQWAGVPELTSKYMLYFEGGRESHIGPIWQSFNFWLCVGASFVFLGVCRPADYRSVALHSYVALFLSLILFSIPVPDVSERFFPALMLVLPLMGVLVIRCLEIPHWFAEAAVTFGFFALWFLVCTTESAQTTLGFEFLKGC